MKKALLTLITTISIALPVTGLAAELDIKATLYQDMINVQVDEPISSETNNVDQIFTISYTSGTSGNSKGVMLSNGNFLGAITNILAMASTFRFSNEDVYISSRLPPFCREALRYKVFRSPPDQKLVSNSSDVDLAR